MHKELRHIVDVETHNNDPENKCDDEHKDGPSTRENVSNAIHSFTDVNGAENPGEGKTENRSIVPDGAEPEGPPRITAAGE